MSRDSLQRYPFLRLLMPLVGGIVCAEQFSYTLPSIVWLVGLILLAALYAFSHSYVLSRVYGAVVFLFIFGFGGSLVHKQLERTKYAFSAAPAVYKVTLQEKPEVKARSIMFSAVLRGEVEEDTLLSNPQKNLFLIYFPKDTASYSLRRGDELLIYTSLMPPKNNGNPDEFDYARYLIRKGVSGTAYVPANAWLVVGRNDTRTIRQIALDYRERLIALYRSLGFSGDELGVLSALTVGDKDELSEDIIETYSVTGASHVLALSGLHIGFIYALFFFLLAPLWGRWKRLKPYLLVLIVILLWAYAFFTGLSSSVVRSVVMFSFLALASLQYEKPLTMNTLAATAFLMLLYNPAWLFDVGFQLSFSAVASILLLQSKLYRLWMVENRALRYVWSLMTVSVAAQIGTAPIIILYFSRFSTHFLLTNLVVIPWVSLIMYASLFLLLLTPLPVLQQAFAVVVDALVRVQNTALRWIEQLPASSIDNIWTDAWKVLLLYTCLFLIIRGVWRHTTSNIYLALAALLIGVSYHSFTRFAYSPRQSITFYNVRDCAGVHCLTDDSHSWWVCADTLPDTSPAQRALSPYWNRLRLQRPTFITGDYSLPELSVRSGIVSYKGKRICMVNNDSWATKISDTPIFVDYLYISKGYRGSAKELLSVFSVGTVVLDASIPAYLQTRIIDTCVAMNVSYLSLSEKGSSSIWL